MRIYASRIELTIESRSICLSASYHLLCINENEHLPPDSLPITNVILCDPPIAVRRVDFAFWRKVRRHVRDGDIVRSLMPYSKNSDPIDALLVSDLVELTSWLQYCIAIIPTPFVVHCNSIIRESGIDSGTCEYAHSKRIRPKSREIRCAALLYTIP